jgi:hypothetical protein
MPCELLQFRQNRLLDSVFIYLFAAQIQAENKNK